VTGRKPDASQSTRVGPHVLRGPSLCLRRETDTRRRRIKGTVYQDHGLGLKSGLTLALDYSPERAPEVLCSGFGYPSSEAAKNLIRHLESPGLRPNENGSPAPTVRACLQVPSAGFGGHSEGHSTNQLRRVNPVSSERVNFLRRLPFGDAKNARPIRWEEFVALQPVTSKFRKYPKLPINPAFTFPQSPAGAVGCTDAARLR
jgi:hypothetical protein